MPKRIVPPSSELRWGLLVKSWATGKNYLTPTDPPIPMPHTFAEFEDLCNNKLNLGLQLEGFKAIVFVQPSMACITIRLPPKEIVEANEEGFSGTGTYELPDFYNQVYGRLPNIGDTKEDKMRFHALRIGDYTISMCA
jgi:hypothetical protein